MDHLLGVKSDLVLGPAPLFFRLNPTQQILITPLKRDEKIKQKQEKNRKIGHFDWNEGILQRQSTGY
ncbi:hypothetical protein AKJ61_04635 [candidate division MSBL1 archaeon SCGC-AAA259B11]|uniref:Uncharacterized protein n=1 Tax=candidate division MSBL1 archaeon SCGC-AAA259B11 TaxID=1698260 RepID=A0A133U319_9EURY|nr:hypothetical protein AKJ61_04635 [candidate division MSBL1 archaeon SCGC-AAA259B11]